MLQSTVRPHGACLPRYGDLMAQLQHVDRAEPRSGRSYAPPSGRVLQPKPGEDRTRSAGSPGDVSPKAPGQRGRVCDAPRGLPDVGPG